MATCYRCGAEYPYILGLCPPCQAAEQLGKQTEEMQRSNAARESQQSYHAPESSRDGYYALLASNAAADAADEAEERSNEIRRIKRCFADIVVAIHAAPPDDTSDEFVDEVWELLRQFIIAKESAFTETQTNLMLDCFAEYIMVDQLHLSNTIAARNTFNKFIARCHELAAAIAAEAAKPRVVVESEFTKRLREYVEAGLPAPSKAVDYVECTNCDYTGPMSIVNTTGWIFKKHTLICPRCDVKMPYN